MTILITNDDGLHARGIHALEEGVAGLGKSVVVAPWHERSGASHALTMHAAIRLWEATPGHYAVVGTPVDCVYLGVHQVLEEPPALVVSGINRGANLGDDAFYSGTVGAAREEMSSSTPSRSPATTDATYAISAAAPRSSSPTPISKRDQDVKRWGRFGKSVAERSSRDSPTA